MADKPKVPPSTVLVEALDAKSARTRLLQPMTCPECRRLSPDHGIECSMATVESAKAEIARSHKNESWARNRASFWLNECRKMHGKLAMLKAELKKLRARR